MRHRLTWLSVTRADIRAAANLFSQVTESTFDAKDNSDRNEVIKKVLTTRSSGLQFDDLDASSLRLIRISDFSFAKNHDLTSQTVYIILQIDKTLQANILFYASDEFKLVVSSVLGGETYVFHDCFHDTYGQRNDLSRLLKNLSYCNAYRLSFYLQRNCKIIKNYGTQIDDLLSCNSRSLQYYEN